MKKIKTFLMCLLLIACSNNQKPATPSLHQLNVVTTIYPLTYFTEQIGGQHVSVTSILEPGADLHQLHLQDQQINQMMDADLVIYIDGTSETYLTELTPSLETSDVNHLDIVKQIKSKTAPQIGEGQTLISGTLTIEESNGANPNPLDELLSEYQLERSNETNAPIQNLNYDPYNHLWLHPSYALMICELIRDQLIALMPEYQPIFESNFNELRTRLMELNTAFESFSNLKQPYFLVTHGAYSVWESYGLIQLPLSNTLEVPINKTELNQLVKLAQNLDLSCIYFEPNISSLTAREIQNQLHLKPLDLYNLATLTPEQIKNGENYFTLMYQNIDNLKQEIH